MPAVAAPAQSPAAQPRDAAPSPAADLRAEQMREIEAQRAQLAEVQRVLAASEQQMIRKWARHRAAVTISCVMMLAAICAVGSWFVAGHVSPPVMAASVALEAHNRAKSPLTGDKAE